MIRSGHVTRGAATNQSSSPAWCSAEMTPVEPDPVSTGEGTVRKYWSLISASAQQPDQIWADPNPQRGMIALGQPSPLDREMRL